MCTTSVGRGENRGGRGGPGRGSPRGGHGRGSPHGGQAHPGFPGGHDARAEGMQDSDNLNFSNSSEYY